MDKFDLSAAARKRLARNEERETMDAPRDNQRAGGREAAVRITINPGYSQEGAAHDNALFRQAGSERDREEANAPFINRMKEDREFRRNNPDGLFKDWLPDDRGVRAGGTTPMPPRTIVDSNRYAVKMSDYTGEPVGKRQSPDIINSDSQTRSAERKLAGDREHWKSAADKAKSQIVKETEERTGAKR